MFDKFGDCILKKVHKARLDGNTSFIVTKLHIIRIRVGVWTMSIPLEFCLTGTNVPARLTLVPRSMLY